MVFLVACRIAYSALQDYGIDRTEIYQSICLIMKWKYKNWEKNHIVAQYTDIKIR